MRVKLDYQAAVWSNGLEAAARRRYLFIWLSLRVRCIWFRAKTRHRTRCLPVLTTHECVACKFVTHSVTLWLARIARIVGRFCGNFRPLHVWVVEELTR